MCIEYDIIVVGGGHAGCEAANIAATMGSKVILITMNINAIGSMSCNPAMGGIAKGQIIREIDAMGGLSGLVSDISTIQFRMLNKSKGPAMWSPRSQNDRYLFSKTWRKLLEKNKNISFRQDTVDKLLINSTKVIGVKTILGSTIKAKSIILTNGTFLNGLIHIGDKNFQGGRSGEKASTGITEQLISLGFKSGRMKTGTPPRLDGRTINYKILEEQKGDDEPKKFSFSTKTKACNNQKSCFITYTNLTTHKILEKGFKFSPIFNGNIKSKGPRYCPSIEDKIHRFSERDRHQLFIEPEGKDTTEIYLNGFSTSLPEEIQHKALRSIKGMEKVKMTRPGYAIEYDFFPPTQLKIDLSTKILPNLFFSGQINGTTGYEEAACQGLIAGINAHRHIRQESPLILKRSDAYIGVLIDDLINKGTDEPYRMFTSRAEYRLLLRQDNADIRLAKIAYDIGSISKRTLNKVCRKIEDIQELTQYLNAKSIDPLNINPVLENSEMVLIKQKVKLSHLLKRPQISIDLLKTADPDIKDHLKIYKEEIEEQAEIAIKYHSYFEKEKFLVNKFLKLEELKLNSNLDYYSFKSLSTEAREKLSRIRPINLGQASRISGISQSDITTIMLHLTK